MTTRSFSFTLYCRISNKLLERVQNLERAIARREQVGLAGVNQWLDAELATARADYREFTTGDQLENLGNIQLEVRP